MDMLSLSAAAVAVGIASALLPLINAEAALIGAAVASSVPMVVAAALALAVGQTLGKLVLFESARRGVSWRASRRDDQRVQREWQRRAVAVLHCRWRGGGIVLLSATVGLPPLAVTSVASGAAQSRRGDFVTCCLAGRSARFLAIGIPLALGAS